MTVVVVCCAAAYLRAPDGRMPGSNLSQHYTGDTAFKRTALCNLVPEADQLKLGSYLFARVDPLMDEPQAVHLRALLHAVYGETDPRIPVAIIKDNVAFMKATGLDVQAKYYPGEDHFLFFSQRDDTVRTMADWLLAQCTTTAKKLSSNNQMLAFGPVPP